MTDGLPDYGISDVSSVTSPLVNADRRISAIGTCIHTTSGFNSLSWLMGDSARSGKPASADYLIGRIGERTKITPGDRYAYHAGQSALVYNDRVYRDNEVSQLLIGIEIECSDTELVTWQQYDSLAQTIVEVGLDKGWRWPYYLVGHYSVARPLGRRSDPVSFNWGALMGRLYVRAKAADVGGL